MKVQIYSLGCRLNKAEALIWEKQLKESGLKSDREVVIVNTCAVTAKAEKETRQLLRQLRHKYPQALLAAAGCWATLQNQKLKIKDQKLDKNENLADLLFDNKNKKDLVEIIRNYLEKKNKEVSKTSSLSRDKVSQLSNLAQFEKAGRYFVKIQDGCDKFCSYCIVPFLRGRSRSINPDEIIRQINSLVKKGAQEVTLTGVDIAHYQAKSVKCKVQNCRKDGLSGLLSRILEETEIPRIRLGSVYPETFTDELLKLYSKNWPRLCRHFHISLQSGCNKTLKRMNRRYTVEEFKQTLKRIRKAIPGVNITTDVIVGFPGETKTEFSESYKNIKAMGFGKIHVFPFSLRPGTTASKKEKEWGRVTHSIKLQRAKKMRTLSQTLSQKLRQKFIGKKLTVLVEGRDKNGSWWGLSDNYIRVKVNSQKKSELGQIKALNFIQG
ncbi:tRNA (N(6)-L-threonylcarbamoyladenosine(37)-C(2))-methylthiotransferase MtaB [Candidatus Beckwithbacteria bacterium RBG_13_42_9]|uniref:tRNA (N(6)-L-threonylcarbamoyladenosine(37)-C(2))-methylthiotransferase MtaB n=1 Tax=Candidatus Beckwithbacteria bacterium RBG_13_42_9 TaxID=1797457 RepID=A0A1F5E6E8_9BACT|nr:MAG: tRNA (N(6)-L-threonylcarbamoyladenosine(37)-C(2))-methylthiotransferase MtaB [Candidatus Beckwithbacteria bacterium RBG_13_42_9]